MTATNWLRKAVLVTMITTMTGVLDTLTNAATAQ